MAFSEAELVFLALIFIFTLVFYMRPQVKNITTVYVFRRRHLL